MSDQWNTCLGDGWALEPANMLALGADTAADACPSFILLWGRARCGPHDYAEWLSMAMEIQRQAYDPSSYLYDYGKPAALRTSISSRVEHVPDVALPVVLCSVWLCLRAWHP